MDLATPPRWMQLLRPFTAESWVAVAASFVVVAVVFWLLSRLAGVARAEEAPLLSLGYFINQSPKVDVRHVENCKCCIFFWFFFFFFFGGRLDE